MVELLVIFRELVINSLLNASARYDSFPSNYEFNPPGQAELGIFDEEVPRNSPDCVSREKKTGQ